VTDLAEHLVVVVTGLAEHLVVVVTGLAEHLVVSSSKISRSKSHAISPGKVASQVAHGAFRVRVGGVG
jgi:hypothetical protein